MEAADNLIEPMYACKFYYTANPSYIDTPTREELDLAITEVQAVISAIEAADSQTQDQGRPTSGRGQPDVRVLEAIESQANDVEREMRELC